MMLVLNTIELICRNIYHYHQEFYSKILNNFVILFFAIFISSIFQEEIQVAWRVNVLYNKKMNPLQGSSNFSHSSDGTKEWVKEDKETWCLVLEEVTLQFRFYLLKFVPHCLAKNMTKHLNCFWMCNRQKTH